jgi:hypothetical protein
MLARQKTRPVNRAPKDQKPSEIKVVSPLGVPWSSVVSDLACQTLLFVASRAIGVFPGVSNLCILVHLEGILETTA